MCEALLGGLLAQGTTEAWNRFGLVRFRAVSGATDSWQGGKVLVSEPLEAWEHESQDICRDIYQ